MHLQSGIEHGVTLGTPIGLLVKNEDQRPHDYSETDLYPRPSHADYTYLQKYGIKASSGGGRSSARETIGPLILHLRGPMLISSFFVIQVVLPLGRLPRSISKKLTVSRLSPLCPLLAKFVCPHPMCLPPPLLQTKMRMMTESMMRCRRSSAHYSRP